MRRAYRLLYTSLGILLGLVFVPDALELLLSPPKLPPIEIPFARVSIDVSLVGPCMLALALVLYAAGIAAARTDAVILSVFVVHIVFAVLYPGHAEPALGGGPYGMAMQMFTLTVAYLAVHNLVVRGSVGEGARVRARRKPLLEALNVAVLVAGPVALAYFFLVLSGVVMALMERVVLTAPEPLNRILYAYLFNPYSRLFTMLAVMGGVVWILKSLIEPIMLYLRLGGRAAVMALAEECEAVVSFVERRDLKARIGELPSHGSLAPLYTLPLTLIGVAAMIMTLVMGPATVAGLRLARAEDGRRGCARLRVLRARRPAQEPPGLAREAG